MNSNLPALKKVKRLIGNVLVWVTLCPPGRSANPWHLTDLPDGSEESPISDSVLAREQLQGACDDDCEVTAPYLSMCPDESTGEGVSPLDFRSTWTDTMPIVGFNASVVDSLIDAQGARQRRPPQHKFSHRS